MNLYFLFQGVTAHCTLYRLGLACSASDFQFSLNFLSFSSIKLEFPIPRCDCTVYRLGLACSGSDRERRIKLLTATGFTPDHLLYHTISYHTISYHTISYHTTPYLTVQTHHTILHQTTPHRYCTMLQAILASAPLVAHIIPHHARSST